MEINMNEMDALKIMHIDSQIITRELIKKTYRKLTSKYHPDRNPNGLKIMQDINRAYKIIIKMDDDILNKYNQKIKIKKKNEESASESEIENLRSFGLTIKIIEEKIWVYGKTYYYRELLKSCKFKWNPKEKSWWKQI